MKMKRFRVATAGINHDQILDLCIGSTPGNSAFRTEAQRRAAWQRYKIELKAKYPKHFLPSSHAEIVYDLGGFHLAEGQRVTKAEERLIGEGKI